MAPLTDRDTRILTAAIAVLSRYGLRRTTMGDIAEAADISRQTLYAAYAGKDEVILAALAHLKDDMLAAIEKKAKTGKIPATKKPRSTAKVTDLVALLKKSVAASKKGDAA